MNQGCYVSIHLLSMAALHLYFSLSPSCIISASISCFFSIRKTLFGLFVLICVCACVFLWHIIPHVCFPRDVCSAPLAEYECVRWMDRWRERERERVENVSVIKLLPLSRRQMSSSLSPDPSISISSTPQLLYTSILSLLFLSNLMYSCYFSLTYFYCLSSPSSSEKQGWTDILGHLSIPWLFDQPDNLLRSLKYLSKTDLFIIKSKFSFLKASKAARNVCNNSFTVGLCF